MSEQKRLTGKTAFRDIRSAELDAALEHLAHLDDAEVAMDPSQNLIRDGIGAGEFDASGESDLDVEQVDLGLGRHDEKGGSATRLTATRLVVDVRLVVEVVEGEEEGVDEVNDVKCRRTGCSGAGAWHVSSYLRSRACTQSNRV